MSASGWWAGSYADVEYENVYTLGDFPSSRHAIEAALKEGLGTEEEPNALFYIVEAQCSDNEDGDDITWFTQTRNKQLYANVSGEAVPA